MDSKKQVLKLLDSRIFFMAGKLMELVEKETNVKIFNSIRSKILDITNNIIRANHEDLNDYSISYTPIKIVDNDGEVKYSFSMEAVKVFNHAIFDEKTPSLVLCSPSQRILCGICDCMNLSNYTLSKDNGLFFIRLDFIKCKQNMHILKRIAFSKERYNEFKRWYHIIDSISDGDIKNAG